MTYDYPLWYIFLSVMISFALTYYMYRKYLRTSYFLFAAFLRFLSLLFISIAIGGLFIHSVQSVKHNSNLYLALDISESMLENVEEAKVIELLRSFEKGELKNDYHIKTLGFGSKTKGLDSVSFTEDITDFAELESYLEQVTEEKDELILISDGNINSGQLNPFSNNREYNLNAIVFGDTTRKSSLAIKSINFNRRVVRKNNFFVEFFIEQENIGNNIYYEISRRGKVIKEGKLENNSGFNNSVIRESVLLRAGKEGLEKYQIKFKSKDGRTQTQRSFNIEVVKNKGNVLVLYGVLNPEVSFFVRKFRESNYKVKSIPVSEFNNSKYDIVVNLSSESIKLTRGVLLNVLPYKGEKSRSVSYSEMIDEYKNTVDINERKKTIVMNAGNLWRLSLKDGDGVSELTDFLKTKLEYLRELNRYRLVYKENYLQNERVEIKLINTQGNLELSARAEIISENFNKSVDFVKNGGFYSIVLDDLSLGVYKIKVYLNSNFYKTIVFEVEDKNIEHLGKGANLELIRSNLKESEQIYFVDNYSDLARKLKQKSVGNYEEKQIKANIIDKWHYFFLIALFLSVEWFIRKRNGLY